MNKLPRAGHHGPLPGLMKLSTPSISTSEVESSSARAMTLRTNPPTLEMRILSGHAQELADWPAAQGGSPSENTSRLH